MECSSKGVFKKMLLFVVLSLCLIFVPFMIADHNAAVARKKQEREEQLSACLALARNNYWVSKEEEEIAGDDPELKLVLAKRQKAGIEAKLKCHVDYESEDKNAINVLEADKTEVDSWISVYESEIKSKDASNTAPSYQYGQPSASTYCTSRQIGTSFYTNCN